MDPSRSRRVSETYQSQMEDSVRRILISKVKLQPKQQQDKVARPVLFQLTLITILLREHVGTAPAAAWPDLASLAALFMRLQLFFFLQEIIRQHLYSCIALKSIF